MRTRINAILPFQIHSIYPNQIITMLSGVFGVIILPVMLSLLARRRTFLWGLLPTLLVTAWRDIADILNGQSYRGVLLFNLELLTLLPIFTFGPVSLIRYLGARSQHGRNVLAMVGSKAASATEGGGIWPPPPDFSA